MGLTKKVLILKQATEGFSISDRAVSGIARFETDCGITSFHLSLINLSVADGGNYYIAIHTPSSPLLLLDLGLRPLTFNKTLENFNHQSPVSVALCFIHEDIPSVIAFATDGGIPLVEFRKLLAEKCLENRTLRNKNVYQKQSTPKNYDDEAIATDNYYDNDLTFSDKLKLIERIDNEFVRNADATSNCTSEKETGKEQTESSVLQNEKLSDSVKTDERKGAYYLRKKDRLDNLFSSHPPFNELSKVIPESEWVKLNYDNDKYYVVGLIKEKGKEKYICYGVPAKFSPYPPRELAGFCSFIPLSVFDLKGNGFWMIFQDAISGKCVKFNQQKSKDGF